jgi:hypothetical protein
VALAPGTPAAQVVVSGDAPIVEVRVDEWPSNQAPPLVLLLDTAGERSVSVRALEPQPGRSHLVARFEGVEPGTYIVAFEPVEPASA